MQTTLPSLGHVRLALDQHLHLIGHLTQSAQDLLVPIHETQHLILDTRLRAKLADQDL